MKLIINISETDYNTYKHFGDKGSYTERIIANGVPYKQEERSKGKWIFDQELNVLTQTGEFMTIYHCSECGNKIKTVESYLPKNHCFCGVCGADMRGDV